MAKKRAKARSQETEISGMMVDTSGDRPVMYLYDEIGESYWGLVDDISFIEALDEIGEVDDIDLRINSPGGDVFKASSMYNALRRHGANIHVHIDGVAASAASVIAMAGDTITIADNGFIMIHEAWTVAVGNKADIQKTVALLEKVDGTLVETYAARTGVDESEIRDMLAAETWLTADEAVEQGFADAKAESTNVTAKIPKDRFKNCPEGLKQVSSVLESPPDRPKPTQPESKDFRHEGLAARIAAKRADIIVGQASLSSVSSARANSCLVV